MLAVSACTFIEVASRQQTEQCRVRRSTERREKAVHDPRAKDTFFRVLERAEGPGLAASGETDWAGCAERATRAGTRRERSFDRRLACSRCACAAMAPLTTVDVQRHYCNGFCKDVVFGPCRAVLAIPCSGQYRPPRLRACNDRHTFGRVGML